MRHRKGSFGLLLLAVAMAGAGACSNQGEGQRCDKNSGDSDCATGLVCKTIQSTASVSSSGSTGQDQLPESVCCPPPGQSATTQVCSNVASFLDAGTVLPAADAGSKGGAGGASTGGEGGASTGGEGGASTGGKADASAAGASHLDASTEAGR